MEFTIQKISNYGTEHPIVARLSIQTERLVDGFFLPREKADAINKLFGLKIQPRLLKCWENMRKIETEYISCQNIPEHELIRSQVLVSPAIMGLDLIVEGFSEECKAILREIIQLLNIFYPTNFQNSKYNKAYDWAKKEFGDNDELTMFLQYHLDKWIEKIQNMRDAIIHPYSTRIKPIIIENTKLNKVSGHLQITVPTWHSEDEAPSFLIDDMKTIITNLLIFSEELLVLLLKKTPTAIYVEIEEIEESVRETTCPIRFISIYKRFPTKDEMKIISDYINSDS